MQTLIQIEVYVILGANFCQCSALALWLLSFQIWATTARRNIVANLPQNCYNHVTSILQQPNKS